MYIYIFLLLMIFLCHKSQYNCDYFIQSETVIHENSWFDSFAGYFHVKPNK